MPSYFIESDQRQEDRFEIDGPLGHHLAGSLRVRVGEVLTLVVDDRRWSVRVTQVARRQVAAVALSSEPIVADPVQLTLMVGYPKGRKLEEITKRAVELGVHEIVPLVTSRSVARPDKGSARGQRLAAIAREAAQQSGRSQIPQVTEAQELAPFLARQHPASPERLAVVLWEGERSRSLTTALTPPARHILLAVGPEGGWHDEEIAQLIHHGFVTAHMGPYTLRLETACQAALAVVGARLYAGALA